MVRDRELLDQLEGLSTTSLSAKVFRATRQGLNPTTFAAGGGRWMVPKGMAVLYTCMQAEGAMSELSFHLSQLTPPPSKPMMVHQLAIEAKKALRITRADFKALGIDEVEYETINYIQCQVVGDAAGFLGCDALLVPSARFGAENLVVLYDNYDINLEIRVLESKEFDWQAWAKKRGYLS